MKHGVNEIRSDFIFGGALKKRRWEKEDEHSRRKIEAKCQIAAGFTYLSTGTVLAFKFPIASHRSTAISEQAMLCSFHCCTLAAWPAIVVDNE